MTKFNVMIIYKNIFFSFGLLLFFEARLLFH